MHIHQERGLTFAEYGALLGTRAMLLNEGIKHDRDKCPSGGEHIFNMGVTVKVQGCGTVSCLGGTMALIMGLDRDAAHHYVDRQPNAGLRGLFYPPMRWSFEDITPAQAVQAIDNFLASGEPDWETVMKDSEQE